jgi:3-phosphoshikimate 1-carboxyvinyltransferase
MTTRELSPSGPVRGTMRVTGSKSIANRALVCAALARGESVLENLSDSDDTSLLVNALDQLGVHVRREADRAVVGGTAGKLYAPKFPIPVGNAGTTTRFLLSLVALAEGKTTLEASDRMAERPNQDLVEALRAQGIDAQQFGPRFVVSGGRLRGGELQVRSNASSQFLSSLLLVAPCASSPMTITGTAGLSSAAYVQLTLDVMRAFGVSVERMGEAAFRVEKKEYTPATFAVEADASGASYPLAAAAITGGEVVVPGLRESSRQSDAAFAGLLRQMGCRVEGFEGGLKATGGGALQGIDVDMNGMPDVVPTLVAVALFAEGTTRIRNVGHLKHKESDRLDGFAEKLRSIGADVSVVDDGLVVVPGPLRGGLLETDDDHRMAMTFALIGLRTPGLSITQPECVKKSYPTFWNELDSLITRV